MRIIVVGCGSIGQRHIRNLQSLGAGEIFVCDPDEKRRELALSRFGVRGGHAGLGEALSRGSEADAALICSPSSLHLEQALMAVEAGLDLFVEKPLSHDLEGVAGLISLVRGEKRILMMGMCYRFHPGLRELKRQIDRGEIGKVLAADLWAGSYLPLWHPQSDYRREYSARRDLGGGVILDSIHSLDSLRWLFGEPLEIACRATKVSDLEIDTEDLAALIAVMPGGAIVQVHVDYLQRPGSSRVEVVGSEGKAIWDASTGSIDLYSVKSPGWHKKPYAFAANDMYLAELAEFLECVRTRRQPETDAVSGFETLRIAVAAKEASASGRFVTLARRAREVEWQSAVGA